jgi:sporulation protein YlmC with PRC-barrel domain
VLSNIKKLIGCRILAIDGECGRVRDVYFDDDQWKVRYLVVDPNGWFGEQSVLIPPSAVLSLDWETRAVAVRLTRRQVESSPDIDTHKPVSRQQEAAYWPYATYWGWGAMPVIMPPDADVEERRRTDHAGGDAHLRSSRAVQGYHVQASNDSIGHVADFLFDEATWGICYLIVDTRNWLPGKHVLVSPRWVRAVKWSEREFRVALTRREIEEGPEYDAAHLPLRDPAKASHRTRENPRSSSS